MSLELERSEKLNAVYQKYDHCKHEKETLRIRVIRGGATQYVLQCDFCGNASNAISKNKAMKINENPSQFDKTIKVNFDAKRQQEIDAVFKEYGTKKAANRAEFFIWYNEYLKTDEWRTKRSLVLQRDNHVCQGCLTAKATQVHHLTYKHVGEELLFELISICESCHGIAHTNDEELNQYQE